MKNFKDEIQSEIDRIISEQKELAKQETDKLLSNSRKEIKEQFETNNETIEDIVIKQSKKSNFAKKMFFIIIGFVFVLSLVFAYYNLDYFAKYRVKEEPKDAIVIDNSNDKLDSLNILLIKLNSNKDCFNSLLTAELGGKKVTLPCGSSSGKKGAGKRTEVWLETIENINVQIDSLKTKINAEIEKKDKTE